MKILRRVERSNRRDERFLLENLSMLRIGQLRLHEQYDEAKTRRLVEKISRDGVFFNPISVVREMIVIDGVNRLEALRRLGGDQVVDEGAFDGVVALHGGLDEGLERPLGQRWESSLGSDTWTRRGSHNGVLNAVMNRCAVEAMAATCRVSTALPSVRDRVPMR